MWQYVQRCWWQWRVDSLTPEDLLGRTVAVPMLDVSEFQQLAVTLYSYLPSHTWVNRIISHFSQIHCYVFRPTLWIQERTNVAMCWQHRMIVCIPLVEYVYEFMFDHNILYIYVCVFEVFSCLIESSGSLSRSLAWMCTRVRSLCAGEISLMRDETTLTFDIVVLHIKINIFVEWLEKCFQ